MPDKKSSAGPSEPQPRSPLGAQSTARPVVSLATNASYSVAFEDLVLAAPEFIWETDPECRFVFVSSQVVNVLGYPATEVVGKTAYDFMPPEDSQRVSAWFLREIVPDKKPFQNLIHRSIRPDGSIVWQRVAGSPVYSADGSLIGYRGTSYDFTKQKQLSDELTRQLAIFRQTEEFAKIGGWELDVVTNQLYWSEQVFAIHELPPPEPTVEEAIKFYTPSGQEIIRKAIEQSIETGTRYDVEVPLITATGRELWIRTVGMTIFEEGGVVKLAGAIQDISEQRRASKLLEEQARELEQAKIKAESAAESKGRFLANISHEVRTPLTGVLGMLDLLKDSGLNSEQVDLLQAAQGAAKSLLIVLNDVLDFSKMEAGKLHLDCRPFSPRGLCQDIARVYNHECREKGLTFEERVDESLPEFVIGDSHRIRQILLNLLANAYKFTPEGGIIELEVLRLYDRGESSRISFVVRDSGIGIAPEQQLAIFGPFVQADTSISRRYGGTGLGLAITAEIVRLMNGELLLESNPGEGTSVTVNLPLPGAPAQITEREELFLEGADHETFRILLVEDNLVNQKLLIRILEKAGHTVYLAENGLEAVHKLVEITPDLILMDMQMPVMGGEEATKILRQDGVKTPIIALTAHALSDDRARFLDIGFNEYIPKPIDRLKLLRAVQELSSRGVDSHP